MIGTAQSAQGRSRASRGWFAALVLGMTALGLGAAPAFAAVDPAASEHTAITKKKDGLSDKAGTLADTAVEKKKDGALDKDAALFKSDLDGIKSPEIKTAGDERKKP